MKILFIVLSLAICASAYAVIAAAPRIHSVHVPGVGNVIWQDGSSRRWVVFPEESCK